MAAVFVHLRQVQIQRATRQLRAVPILGRPARLQADVSTMQLAIQLAKPPLAAIGCSVRVLRHEPAVDGAS